MKGINSFPLHKKQRKGLWLRNIIAQLLEWFLRVSFQMSFSRGFVEVSILEVPLMEVEPDDYFM